LVLGSVMTSEPTRTSLSSPKLRPRVFDGKTGGESLTNAYLVWELVAPSRRVSRLCHPVPKIIRCPAARVSLGTFYVSNIWWEDLDRSGSHRMKVQPPPGLPPRQKETTANPSRSVPGGPGGPTPGVFANWSHFGVPERPDSNIHRRGHHECFAAADHGFPNPRPPSRYVPRKIVFCSAAGLKRVDLTAPPGLHPPPPPPPFVLLFRSH